MSSHNEPLSVASRARVTRSIFGVRVFCSPHGNEKIKSRQSQSLSLVCVSSSFQPMASYLFSDGVCIVASSGRGALEHIGALRARAYLADGKPVDLESSAGLSDTLDDQAEHLCALQHGHLVGPVRLFYHSDDSPTDRGRYVALPSLLAPLSRGTEVSRLCTAPEARGRHIAVRLMAVVVVRTLLAQRGYTWSGAAGSMLQFHERFDYTRIGARYRNAALGGLEHELMVLDCTQFFGNRALPAHWRKAIDPLSHYFQTIPPSA